MKDKGQIVEILDSSPLYKSEVPDFLTKKEELLWYSTPIAYDLFDGILIGGHQGIENFSVGQRKKTSSGGHQLPLYVISIDKNENRIFVGAGKDHPGLFTKVIRISKKDVQIKESDSFFSNNDFKPLSVKIYFDEDYFIDGANLYNDTSELFIEFPKPINITNYNKVSIYKDNNLLATIKI